MFKGTLIEDEKYYKLRSKQLLYIMLPSIAIGLLVNFYQMPIWVTIGAIIFYVATMIFTLRNQKEMVKIANKNIEINSNQIILKDSSGNLLETITIKSDATIKIKENYQMAQETMSDIKEEFKGNVEKHFILIKHENEERRFDFVISSYYMLNQLNKIVKLWQKENYKIEYV